MTYCALCREAVYQEPNGPLKDAEGRTECLHRDTPHETYHDKSTALDRVTDAAGNWLSEMSEYIIPGSSEEPEEEGGTSEANNYRKAYHELDLALGALLPPYKVRIHKECGYALELVLGDWNCPVCEHNIPDAEIDSIRRLDVPYTEEFTEKQTKLAAFLYELYHGEGSWLVDVLLGPASDDRYRNYMKDANDILREQTHLLTLKTVEAMAL